MLLSFLGIIGNYLHISLFFGVDFIFGSIAILIALRMLGITAGVTVAVVSGAYTVFIWGHPYAMIILILEALCVGALLSRRISSLVLADILFWVIVGMPAVWFFYSAIMGMEETQSLVIVLKQPINGIANAILATLLLYIIPGRFFQQRPLRYNSSIRLKDLLFTTLLSVTFFITLVLVIYQNSKIRKDYENNLYQQMELFADYVEHQYVNKQGDLDIQSIQQDYHTSKYQYDIVIVSSGSVIGSSLSADITSNFLNSGKVTRLNSNIQIWMPERKGMPFMLWWKQAYYFINKELTVQGDTIYLLQNSQSIIEKLQVDVTRAFVLLFVLIMMNGLIAYFISNKLTRTILKLTEATRDVAKKLQDGTHIEWPRSAIVELQQLSTQAQLMSSNINETFSDANKRSSTIIEASIDAIITINKSGCIESVNRAAEQLFGYSREELMGKNVRCLMPEPLQSNDDEYIREFIRAKRKSLSGNRRELTGLHKNGSEFPIELSLTKLKLQNDIIYTGIVTDITDRKANEKLKHEFISTVSHELRTPLTSIQGAIKLMKAQSVSQSLESDGSSTLIELADRNVNRLTVLINDLLDFEKLDSEGLIYDMQVLAVDDFISNIIENDKPSAEIAGVELVRGEYCQGNISVDSSRLTQIISNFISNAIKFSPRDSSIRVGCYLQDNDMKIYVSDEGEGIPDHFKGHLFKRFSQADSSDTKQVQRGTGLGLAISKLMTEGMGGEIGFESQSQNGSTFFVIFPLLTN